MNATPDNTTGSTEGAQGRPGPSPIKLWIFFGLFLTVGIAMYAGTMYRIQHYGYTGIGQDQLAHPKQDAQAAPTQPAQN